MSTTNPIERLFWRSHPPVYEMSADQQKAYYQTIKDLTLYPADSELTKVEDIGKYLAKRKYASKLAKGREAVAERMIRENYKGVPDSTLKAMAGLSKDVSTALKTLRSSAGLNP